VACKPLRRLLLSSSAEGKRTPNKHKQRHLLGHSALNYNGGAGINLLLLLLLLLLVVVVV